MTQAERVAELMNSLLGETIAKQIRTVRLYQSVIGNHGAISLELRFPEGERQNRHEQIE